MGVTPLLKSRVRLCFRPLLASQDIEWFGLPFPACCRPYQGERQEHFDKSEVEMTATTHTALDGMGVFTDRGEFGLNSQTTDQMALSIAFGHVGRMFGHRGAVTGLLLALAALVAMPMLGLPHQIGDTDHDDPDCAYDFCHSPEFLVPAPTFQISDNIGQGQEVGALPAATDADHSDPNIAYTMVYTLRDGDAPVADNDEDKPEYADGDAAAFYIYKDGSGQLKLRTALDHYETRVYRLKLVACDGNFRRGYIDVTVTVNDAAGERPLAPDRPEVEGASTSSLVVRWTAPDNTGRAPITSYDLQYRESGTQDWRNGPQKRTDTNAIISGLDTDTEYEVQVRATNEDGDGPWSLPGTGRTKAAGNNPPVFLEGTSATRSLPENIGRIAAPVRNVGRLVTATGEGALTYSLEGTDVALFDIVGTSGQIRTKSSEIYDYETEVSYSVIVKASDQNENNATITVTINITDVDEPPLEPAAPVVSTASEASLSVSWSPPTDNTGRPDIKSYDLQYRRGTSGGWTDGPQDETGTSTTISNLMEDTQYQVQVRATNDEGDGPWSPPGSGRTNVTGNDPPVFPPSTPSSFTFDESMGNEPKPVINVGQVTASDAGDTLTYTLEGPDAGAFVIESGTGQIKTRSGMVYDFEAKDAYTVTVTATDSHQISAATDVSIRLDDVSEPPLAPAAPTVSGRSITSLSTNWRPPTDNRGRPPIDSYDLQYLTCPAEQCPANPEDTDWTNGPQVVTGTTSAVISGLDENTRYQVRVRATNAEGSGGWSQPGTGRTLAEPEFADTMATRSIAENTPPNRNVGAAIQATDADNDALTYTLEGTDAASFDIEPLTGQIKTKSGVVYDHETKPSYSVTVRASDPTDASDTIAVTIEITNVNEPPLAPAAPSVSSDSTTSLSVVWTAPDNAGRPAITGYDLQYRRQGTSDEWSPWSHSGTGTSATITGLNEDTLYQVQVMARNNDGPSPWSAPGSGRTLAQGNSAPTFDDGASTTRSFDENTAAGEDIGTPVAATDTDSGDTLAYNLEGADAASFTIVQTSGQIKTKAGVAYDHEARSSYSVTVKADDGKGGTDVIAVTINVADVPEPPDAPAAPSVSGQSPTSLSVIWSPPADNTGRPLIIDYDLQYRRQGTNAWSSWPHNGTGTTAVISSSALVAGTNYEVQVQAKNDEGDSPWSDSGFGQTNVAGNNPPEFVGDMTTRRFRENTPPGRNIGTPVTATDADGGTLTYTLEGRDAESFTIVGTSGQIRTRSGVTYDYETKRTYFVTVKTDDKRGGTDIIAVTIYVTDETETGRPDGGRSPSSGGEGPSFTASTATRSFPENTPPGQNIGDPVTAKESGDDPLTYTVGGSDAASFDIDAKTGQLKTKAGVTYDHETKDTYTVTVKATDSSRFSDTIAVTIRVTNVDEKPATPDAPTVSAPEGSTTSLLATWTTPERNGGPPIANYDVQYRQGTSGDWSDWGHDGTDTTITGLAPHTDYQVRVRAFNGELHSDWSPPGSGQTNNTVPAFADTGTTRSFPENTPPGQDIGTPVAAGDPDGDPLVHTLSGPTRRHSISSLPADSSRPRTA